jgi:hypothetical protein
MDVPVAANVLGTLGAVGIMSTFRVTVLIKTGLLVRPGIYTHPNRRDRGTGLIARRS